MIFVNYFHGFGWCAFMHWSYYIFKTPSSTQRHICLRLVLILNWQLRLFYAPIWYNMYIRDGIFVVKVLKYLRSFRFICIYVQRKDFQSFKVKFIFSPTGFPDMEKRVDTGTETGRMPKFCFYVASFYSNLLWKN